MIELEVENKALKEEILELKQKVMMLEEKLDSQVVSRNKAQRVYYKNHTEVAQQRTKKYLDNLKENEPERLKAYRHQAYLNRKEKLKNQNQNEIKK